MPSKKSTPKPETPDDWQRQAEAIMPKPKRQVSLRLDDDLVTYYKGTGAGWQTRINAILRAYMMRDGK